MVIQSNLQCFLLLTNENEKDMAIRNVSTIDYMNFAAYFRIRLNVIIILQFSRNLLHQR